MAANGDVRPTGYLSRVTSLVWQSLRRLARAPTHSRRAQARRGMARRSLVLAIIAAVAIVVLMFAVDFAAIRLVPVRGAPNLWPVRIFTDFAKSTYVLWTLTALLAIIILALPRLHEVSRSVLAAFGIQVQFVFFSVFVAVMSGEILKPLVGRGRPFVGGDISVLNFSPFAGTEAFASLPSGHAVTACALAFSVSSLWPRLSAPMWIFAILICISRVVLLAHHPSDVVAGALVGVTGAMTVRYWFAARRLGFAIRSDGSIAALDGPSWTALKGVAREAFTP